MQKFISIYNNGDEVAAKAVINDYQTADSYRKEGILISWICGRTNPLPIRIAKKVFGIGHAKYIRIKKLKAKKKPGGINTNSVRSML